jgi:hypothetical protein
MDLLLWMQRGHGATMPAIHAANRPGQKRVGRRTAETGFTACVDSEASQPVPVMRRTHYF